MKVITSRDFNQDVSRAKRAARIEPVFVTDRGTPTHVLMSIEDWQRMNGDRDTLVDLLAMPGLADPGTEPRDDGAWDRGV